MWIFFFFLHKPFKKKVSKVPEIIVYIISLVLCLPVSLGDIFNQKVKDQRRKICAANPIRQNKLWNWRAGGPFSNLTLIDYMVLLPKVTKLPQCHKVSYQHRSTIRRQFYQVSLYLITFLLHG